MSPEVALLLKKAEQAARSGSFADALARFREIADQEPNCFDAVFWLSILHRNRGEFTHSTEYARRAIALRPHEAHVYSNLGLTQLGAGAYREAELTFRKAIDLNPKVAQNYHQLGVTLQMQGANGEAVTAFRQALRLAPSFETLLALGQIALSQNRNEEALEYGNRATTLNPNSPAAQLLVAGALIDQGLSEAAADHIEAALRSDPKNGAAHAILGLRLQSLGHMEQADEAFRKSIELQPNQGLSYCALLRNSKVTPAQEEIIEKMEALCKAGRISLRGIDFLHYGLGKAYEDLKRYEEAMAQFDRANEIAHRLKFGTHLFDRKGYSAAIDRTIETFNQYALTKPCSEPNSSTKPIFVVGMMRSGTTLVEQILSSHPQVAGAGERSFWLRHAHEAMDLNPSHLTALAEKYLEELTVLFPNSPYVTDKMPGNYRVLGLLALAFPQAKFIHTKRHPIDTCLSIYSTPNRSAGEFAHNRDNIVFAYQEYERLMRHWKKVLPEGRLLTMCYEELVANPERIARAMVDFCGLDWDDRCLHPEENVRTVITPSVWQVRQPVYTSSVEKWKRYEKWLGPFQKLA